MRIDQSYPGIEEFEIDKNGRPVLKKREPKRRQPVQYDGSK